jgi:hypothetical protein
VTSGAARILRVRVIMIPTVLHHMIVSSGQPHADLHLSMEAEQADKMPRSLEAAGKDHIIAHEASLLDR